MIIKSYKTNVFAGLKDVDIDFKKGLNVLYGVNEAGKSTVVDGIHATLFQDTNFRLSTIDGRQFNERYFPYGNKGDTIDGQLLVSNKDGDYKIEKVWGTNKSASFTDKDKSVYNANDTVNQKISDLLDLGESTYSNIVFAKQRDLKAALTNILNNKDISNNLTTILHTTFMELDGISIDKLEENIANELEELYRRWDRDKDAPQGNHGIRNPYKTGLGSLLQAYYNKENTEDELEKAERAEIDYNNAANEYQTIKEKLASTRQERRELESIEGDINEREKNTIKLESLMTTKDKLTKISQEWPKTDERLKSITKSLDDLSVQSNNLEEERKKLDSSKKKEELKSKLSSIESLQKKLEELEKDKNTLGEISENDLNHIQKLIDEINTEKPKLEAGQIIGNIKLTTNKKLTVTEDFQEKEIDQKEYAIDTKGLVKINYADELFLEIKGADVDFQAIKDKLNKTEGELASKYQELGVTDIQEARDKQKTASDLNNQINSAQAEINGLLAGSNYQDLKEELAQLELLVSKYSPEELEAEINRIKNEQEKLKKEEAISENLIANWQEEYTDSTNLMDKLVENLTEIKAIESELTKLKSLPEAFNSIQEFKDKLSQLREDEADFAIKKDDIFANFAKLKHELPDTSTQELAERLKDQQVEFDLLKKRGEILQKVQDTFIQAKEEMDNNPLAALVKSFGSYLSEITDKRYKIDELDDKFNLKLTNPQGEISIDLLSAGTYDSVALALRFALLELIFADDSGFLILDDCLVDLDKDRKKEAIKLIKKLAKKHQVIFTTCDEDTAKLLDGNLITLESNF